MEVSLLDAAEMAARASVVGLTYSASLLVASLAVGLSASVRALSGTLAVGLWAVSRVAPVMALQQLLQVLVQSVVAERAGGRKKNAFRPLRFFTADSVIKKDIAWR